MMKKLFCLLLALCTLFCCFACKKEEPNSKFDAVPTLESLYIIGTSNNETVVSENYDFPWSQTSFQNDIAEPSVTVEVLGITYTGEYKDSMIYKLNSFTTDYYRCEDGAYIGIRSDTGVFQSINLMTNSFFETEPLLPDVEEPQKYAIDYGKSIASQYVNIDDYHLVESTSSPYEIRKDGIKYEMTFYYVTYAKIINGLQTSDYISIKLTSKGNVAAITLGDIGAFDSYSGVASVNSNETVISNAMMSVVSTDVGEYQSHEVSDQKLTKLPNGEVMVFSYVNVNYTNARGKASEQTIGVLVPTQ